MEKSPSEDRLDLLHSLLLFWRMKFWIVGAGLLAGLVAFVVVKQIEPLYESHATLLPSNSNSRQKQMEEFNYGYEVHSERLIQLLGSEIILDSLENKFGLSEKYGIDMEGPEGWDQLNKVARERIQFHKTRYSSVVISVQDESPEDAARIANETGRLVNVVSAEILRQNSRELLRAAERDYRDRIQQASESADSIGHLQDSNESAALIQLKEQERARQSAIRDLQKTLNGIRQQHQIFDYGFQVNILNEQIAEARAILLQESGALEVLEHSEGVPDSLRVIARAKMKGAEKRVEYFQERLDLLTKVGTEYSSLLEQLTMENELLAEVKEAINELYESYEPAINSRELESLEDDYYFERIRIRELGEVYQRAMQNYVDPVPVAHVISPARPSYRKIYPKTFLSVLIAGIGAALMAMVVISLLDRFPSNKA